MPSTYTVNLGIEKPATGEQSGTWGDTTNVNFDIIDQAVNGSVRVTLTNAGTSGSPNDLNIVNGSTTSSEGRNKWIEIYSASDLGGSAYVRLVPNDAEKILFIRNSLAGSQSVLLFQGTYNASNDLEIPAGVDMVVKFDGAGASATVTDVFTKLRATEITTPTLTAGTADINGGSVDGATVGAASASTGAFTTLTASTSLNIASSTTVDGVLDEDNMASDSATKLATQQSIKAYVDSQVGTVDTLAEILANGNTSGANNLIIDSGQALTANTINETTAGSGVTIDSVLLKDDVVNATDVETSNISANDGTAAATIANSTGLFTITSFASSSVNIDGGSIDGTNIGASSAGTGAFTTLSASGNLTVDTDTLYVDSTNDRVGVNVAAPDKALDVLSGTSNSDVAAFSGTSSGRGLVISTFDDSGTNADAMVDFDAISGAGQISFSTTTDEAMRIDSSQRVLINHTSSVNSFGSGYALQVFAGTTQNAALFTYRDGSDGAGLNFNHSRNTTFGSFTILQDNDKFGSIRFLGDDGVDLATPGALIESAVDGTPGANDMPGRLSFSTTADGAASSTERLRIDSSGVVDIKGVGSAAAPSLILAGDGDTGWYRPSANHIGFSTSGAVALTIDSGQRLLFGPGNTATVSVANGTAALQWGDTGATAISALRYTAASGGPFFMFGKSRSTSVGTVGTIVQSGDDLGTIRFAGDDGTDVNSWGATIKAQVDGTPGTDDMPGRLVFGTTLDGNSTSTDHMYIYNDGKITFGTDSTGYSTTGIKMLPAGSNGSFAVVSEGNPTIYANRRIGDGDNIIVANDGVQTGAIGVNTTGGSQLIEWRAEELMRFMVNDVSSSVEAIRIDTSARVLVGRTAVQTLYGATSLMEVSDVGGTKLPMALSTFRNDTAGAYLALGKSRGTSQSTYTTVNNGDSLGHIGFLGADGTDLQSEGGYIELEVDATPGANDMPGRFVFATTSDGAATPTERLRIDSSGTIVLQTVGAKFFFQSTSGYAPYIHSGGGSNRALNIGAGNYLRFQIDEYGTATHYYGTTPTTMAAFGGSNLVNGVSGTPSNAGTPFVVGRDTGTLRSAHFAGNLKFDNGYGIDFGASSGGSATSTTLDDYEEGTWVATAEQGCTGVASSTANNRYTKVGNVVSIIGEMSSFTGTDANTLEIGGLPYAVASGFESSSSILYTTLDLDSGYTNVVGYAKAGSSRIRLYEVGDNVAYSALRGDQMGSGSFIMQMTYHTTS